MMFQRNVKTAWSRGLAALGLILMVVTACPSQPDPVVIGETSFGTTAPSPNKRRLLNYLADNYGKKIISGQMDISWDDAANMDMIKRVYDDTGKYPALKGFDFLNFRQPASWGGGGSKQTEEAIAWWEGKNSPGDANPLVSGKHGIVAFCWHWRMPLAGTARGNNEEFYTERTAFRIPWKNGALDTAAPAWQLIEDDLDKVAAELAKLQAKDIPVLWRPLHEASGGWFWWGASGPAPYIALWEYMFDYLYNRKALKNLVWVWNGQDAAWYPNPATVDIVGYDVYPPKKDYGSQAGVFVRTQAMAGGNRIVALTENGEIPDPDACETANALWSWFMTWNDGGPAGNDDNNFWSGENHNTAAHKQKVYRHPLVITLDKLPDLTAYSLE